MLENRPIFEKIVFATDQFLQLVTETAIVFTDWTFKCYPYPFEQLSVIVGTSGERKIPLFFVLRRQNNSFRKNFPDYQAKSCLEIQISPVDSQKNYFRF